MDAKTTDNKHNSLHIISDLSKHPAQLSQKELGLIPTDTENVSLNAHQSSQSAQQLSPEAKYSTFRSPPKTTPSNTSQNPVFFVSTSNKQQGEYYFSPQQSKQAAEQLHILQQQQLQQIAEKLVMQKYQEQQHKSEDQAFLGISNDKYEDQIIEEQKGNQVDNQHETLQKSEAQANSHSSKQRKSSFVPPFSEIPSNPPRITNSATHQKLDSNSNSNSQDGDPIAPGTFQKKINNFSSVNPIYRYFECDLNLQFSKDPNKFLGVFKSNDRVYKVDRQFVKTADPNIKLYHSKFVPLNCQPKATLLIVHGFYEYSGLYINFADYFVRAGFEVHLYDQRGFGYTGGVTRSSSTIEFQRDFTEILKLVNPSLPLFIYAHSTGVLGVLTYLIMNPSIQPSALITLNALLRIPKTYHLTKNKILLGQLALLFYQDILINPKINLSALCKNSYHIKKIVSDEHISPHLSLRTGMSIVEMCKYVQTHAKRITFPMFVVHGKEDVVNIPENSLELFNLISSQKKKLHLLEGGFHQPHLDTHASDVHNLIHQYLITRLEQPNVPFNVSNLDRVRYGCGVTLDKATAKRIVMIFLVLYLLKLVFGDNSKDKLVIYCKLFFKNFKHYLYEKLKEVRDV